MSAYRNPTSASDGVIASDVKDSSRDCAEIYDRSSLKGDFMVVLEGQSEEDYLCRRPEDQFCELFDGIVYFHPPKDISRQELEASRSIYDRSSLTGDFMVILEDQTSEDFERYAPERQPCDYLEGRAYMPSPATMRHQEQVGFFHSLLDGFREVRGGWKVLLGPAVLRIDQEHKPEPDLFVIPNPTDPNFSAPAALVIEILSPSTRSHDLTRKLQAYKAAGIPEIWFLDEREQHLIVERRQGDLYQRQSLSTGCVASSAILGFWIDLGCLWRDPLPGPRRCLERILAGPPA